MIDPLLEGESFHWYLCCWLAERCRLRNSEPKWWGVVSWAVWSIRRYLGFDETCQFTLALTFVEGQWPLWTPAAIPRQNVILSLSVAFWNATDLPIILRLVFMTFDKCRQRDRICITTSDDRTSTIGIAFLDVFCQLFFQCNSPRFRMFVNRMRLIFRCFTTQMIESEIDPINMDERSSCSTMFYLKLCRVRGS